MKQSEIAVTSRPTTYWKSLGKKAKEEPRKILYGNYIG